MIEYVKSPAWTRDLIVYEIATKTFTSPNGAGTGTFDSARARLPYLAELGINGIWLTGHSLADDRHFYNIWTQYACIEPDKIDPSLGTEQDFKALIDDAHAHGIRVFLDVIIHGVMEDSPLVTQHPDWFRGKSWGMIDYDFDSRLPALDDWWVGVWTRYVVEFGIDGFRLDLGMRRPDLWQRIRDNAAAAGREIIIINELNYRGGREFADQSGMVNIAPREEFLKVIDFVQRDEPTVLSPHHNRREEVNCAFGRANQWGVPQWETWLHNILHRDQVGELPAWKWSSVQISSHDDGWDGFQEANPYVAQGSRFIFGYGALFSGMIPIFMAGEEFDAAYKPLPTLSPNLFGGQNPGRGTWLYGGEIQWSSLDQPANRAMLDDVRRMIAIRKAEADVLAATPNDQPFRTRALTFAADIAVPPPYVRWNDSKAVIVAGNINTGQDAHLTITVIPDEIDLPAADVYRLTDLWTGESQQISRADLANLPVTIKPDKTPGGGLALLRIESA